MATTFRHAASAALLFSFAALILLTTPSSAHNITDILAAYPEYSVYNDFLTQTRVADEINSRETVTCLVLPNAAMSALAAKRPLAAVKAALRLLTLLDYYDTAKLHAVSEGTTLTTTLLQTTGAAAGNLGFVNITDLKGGRVGFGSTAPGSKLESFYTKSVKQMPFSISVLEVSLPITYPGLLDAPARSTANITALLEKAGCKTFASLIESSGVLKIYQGEMDKGLTVFAPSDEAFKADGVPDLNTVTQAELVTLLQYHAIPQYSPKASLLTTKGSIGTLATSGAGKYDIGVTSSGQDVSLKTGLTTSRIANTVIDDTPFCILTVDNVLLPVELFGMAPGPAPALAPGPVVEAPAPAPEKAKAPAADLASPPSPPSDTSPAGAPEKAADLTAKGKTSTSAAAVSTQAIAAATFVAVAALSLLS